MKNPETCCVSGNTSKTNSEHVLMFVVHVDTDGECYVLLTTSLTRGQKKRRLNGGAVEFGETLIQAGKRELKEETGLSAVDWKVLIQKPKFDHETNSIHTQYVLMATVEQLEGFCESVTEEDGEVLYNQWFLLSEVQRSLCEGVELLAAKGPRELHRSKVLVPHASYLRTIFHMIQSGEIS
jgi:ADP-ribose pyrophosphatase YjhB (NUDIX family)